MCERMFADLILAGEHGVLDLDRLSLPRFLLELLLQVRNVCLPLLNALTFTAAVRSYEN